MALQRQDAQSAIAETGVGDLFVNGGLENWVVFARLGGDPLAESGPEMLSRRAGDGISDPGTPSVTRVSENDWEPRTLETMATNAVRQLRESRPEMVAPIPSADDVGVGRGGTAGASRMITAGRGESGKAASLHDDDHKGRDRVDLEEDLGPQPGQGVMDMRPEDMREPLRVPVTVADPRGATADILQGPEGIMTQQVQPSKADNGHDCQIDPTNRLRREEHARWMRLLTHPFWGCRRPSLLPRMRG